jgi:hypothetical protein
MNQTRHHFCRLDSDQAFALASNMVRASPTQVRACDVMAAASDDKVMKR